MADGQDKKKPAAKPKPGLQERIKKIPFWVWIIVGVIGIGAVVFLAVGQPRIGTWRYGVCKVFLDLHVRFPGTMRVNDVLEGPTAARISFSTLNPFGSVEVHELECDYEQAANGQAKLSTVIVDPTNKYIRRRIPDERVEAFNKTLPVLMAQKLDQRLPRALPAVLKNEKDFLKLRQED